MITFANNQFVGAVPAVVCSILLHSGGVAALALLPLLQEKGSLAVTETSWSAAKALRARGWKVLEEDIATNTSIGDGWNNFGLITICEYRAAVLNTHHSTHVRLSFLSVSAVSSCLYICIVCAKRAEMAVGKRKSQTQQMQ